MAKVDYDQFAGLERLTEAAANINQRAAVVLTYHAALEREMDVVLGRLLPRSDRIRSFGFGSKVGVLGAAWKGNATAGEKVCEMLFRFNSLRNAVAHADQRDVVEQKLGRLLAAYREMVPGATEGLEIDALAAGICGFLADNPTPKQLRVGRGLEQVVNKFGASANPSGQP